MTNAPINNIGNLELFKGVWVLAEQADGQLESITYELLGEGRKLANELGTELSAVLLGSNIGNKAQALIERGADKVYLADVPELAYFADEPYAKVISKLIRDYSPTIVLCGATTVGRSLAARVAITVNTGLTADCTALAIDPETRNLLQTRPACGGNIIATIVTPGRRPQIATVRQKVMKEAAIDGSHQGAVVNVALTPDLLTSRTKRLRHVPGESATVNISEANILVAGGRGIQKSEHFDVIGDLAKVLKAGVAASRAAVDSNWISYAHQVGQTGKTVCPKLYIACGISGQIQHLAGMASAETIVAINRDPDAPIFNVATYGVVGDALEIVPRLTAEFKKILGR
ncbi:MAG TPA: electron transfer flavoprotein subunit alpha [Verrucomicrobia bacterium]|nr:electron transfer flavoprotein subunit alpha [Verrucomicrobiota bacterium]